MIENFNIKEKINAPQIIAYLLSVLMIFIVLCNDQFFNVGGYFILPISIVIIGCSELVVYMVKNKKMLELKITDYSIIFILIYVVFSSCILKLPSKFDTVMSYGLLFLLLLVCSLIKFNPTFEGLYEFRKYYYWECEHNGKSKMGKGPD